MALHLRFSGRTEDLLEGLDDLLRTRSSLGPRSPVVVVPSPSIARWIKLRLCETSGPVLGLETTTLESFLWGSLDPADGDELLRVPLLQQAILAILDDQLLGRPSWGAVRRFLSPSGSMDPRRKVQFAHEMARTFLEYEYNRPSVWKGSWVVSGLDRTWPAAPFFHPDQEVETETWQRDLHGLVFAPVGPLQAGAGRGSAMGLPRLHGLRRDTGWVPAGSDAILFGLEKVSHFHRNLLLEISERREVHAFLHNPCASFWEDLDTSRRRGRSSSGKAPSVEMASFRRDPEGSEWLLPTLPERWYPSASRDPMLLERWGRTARENIALWCQATDYDFVDLGEPDTTPRPRTLLGDIQESLRQRHPGPRIEDLEFADGSTHSGTCPSDDSLSLLEAPDRGREMETLRDQILSWLEQDSSRRPGDIVVYLPDPARHRVEIERVFGAYAPTDPAHLPWALLGASSGESRWAQGVQAFLRLAIDAFDRPSIFAVLRNPLCQGRLRIDPNEVALWERWFEGTGTIRGWDAPGADAVLASGVHTVSGGIRRLLLGALCGASGAQIAPDAGTIPPWKDFDTSDAEGLERFCSTIERLHRDAASLRLHASTESPAVLAREFVRSIDLWFEIPDGSAESGVRRSLHEDLRHLERRPETPIGLGELSEIVQSGLDGELPGSSRAWTGAVTFAPLRAGNILPHELVLVPGLDADAFPGEPRTSSLDLLIKSRILGDSDPVDDNRHAFLLALLSARGRLVLSWKARDIQKDEPKDPSSVVLELEEALLTGFVEKPLRRRIRLLEREEPVQGIELPDPGWDSWEREVPDFDPAEAIPTPSTKGWKDSLDTRVLSRFLLDSWNFRIASGLDAEEEEAPDTLGMANEPLEISARMHSILRYDLFPTLLAEFWSGSAREAVRKTALRGLQHASWAGEFPEGIEAVRERRAFLAWVDSLGGHVADWKARWPNALLVTGSDLGLRIPEARSVVELACDGDRSVRIQARLPAALILDPENPSGSPILVLACRRWKDERKIPFRQRIEPSLWTHLLSRLGHIESRALLLSTIDAEVVELPTLHASEQWLEHVVSDLVDGSHEHLPSSILIDKGERTLLSVREKIEEAGFRSSLERLLEPELPGEAKGDQAVFEALIQRRLAPFLQATDAEILP